MSKKPFSEMNQEERNRDLEEFHIEYQKEQQKHSDWLHAQNCVKCKIRQATCEYSMDGIHLTMPYCELCVTEEQLAFAKKAAANLPELEKKYQLLKNSDVK